MRMRFNKDEKSIIESGNRVKIEVHYASGNWIAAKFVSDEPVIERYADGDLQRVFVEITGPSTRVIGKGQRFGVTPGNIRPAGSDWRVK